MPDDRSTPAPERWFEFTEHNTFSRSVYVKATSIAEARKRVFRECVPDYLPTYPDLRIDLRGKLSQVDDAYVEGLRDHA